MRQVYDEQEMLEARLKLLSKTNMVGAPNMSLIMSLYGVLNYVCVCRCQVDFAIDVFGQLHPGLEPEGTPVTQSRDTHKI